MSFSFIAYAYKLSKVESKTKKPLSSYLSEKQFVRWLIVNLMNAAFVCHAIKYFVGDLSFWCYKCEDYVNHLSIKQVYEFLMRLI